MVGPWKTFIVNDFGSERNVSKTTQSDSDTCLHENLSKLLAGSVACENFNKVTLSIAIMAGFESIYLPAFHFYRSTQVGVEQAK
jgi:hypothetical protein